MAGVVNLDAYFARIGYGGGTEVRRATVDALALAHVCAIPFENLDVLMGRPIEVADVAAIEAKLVGARRGGYCFEHNALFLTVLAQLGFPVRPISARVRYGRPRDYTPARTHMFVEVMLDGEAWVADVGVGSMSLTCCLRFADEGRQETPHEPRRLLREHGLIYHQVWFGDRWEDVNELTGETMPVIDRVVGNWYTSTHPQSHFKTRLQAARALPDGRRVSLLNEQLTVRGRDGAVLERVVWQTQAELRGLLRERFGLVVDEGVELRWSAA